MLSTLRQLSLKKTGRVTKVKKDQTKALAGAPYKAGVIIRCYTTTPKKPNSAIRKVAKVRLWTGRKVIVGIPGMGHDLRSNTPVMIRGGRLNDVPGVRYKIIRGKLGADTKENIIRKNARSKYHLSKTGRPRNK